MRNGARPTVYISTLTGTPVGNFYIAVSELGMVALGWLDAEQNPIKYLAWMNANVITKPEFVESYAKELDEYLHGQRRFFSFPIDWQTLKPFQLKVLQAVYAIPYGETRSYAEIAAAIGNPKAYRAVGRANATNPMPLVIPCHRVIGNDGKLHGYGGGQGLPTKAWLLKMENDILSKVSLVRS